MADTCFLFDKFGSQEVIKHMQAHSMNVWFVCKDLAGQGVRSDPHAPMQRAYCALLSRSAACLRLPSLVKPKRLATKDARQPSGVVCGAATGSGGGRSDGGGRAVSMSTAAAPAAALDSPQEQQPRQQGQAAEGEQKQQQQPTGKKQRARARQVAAELRNGRPALWWKDRPSYRCPACGQCCYRVPAFETHILRCCPDVALPDEWRSLLGDAEAQQAAQQGAAGPAGGQAVDQVDEQAAQQQQQAAAGGSGGRGSDGEQEQGPPAWQLHPVDAAIREWLRVVERREEEQRAKAVRACLLLCCCACRPSHAAAWQPAGS